MFRPGYRARTWTALVLAMVALVGPAAARAADPQDDPLRGRLVTGWSALRAMDCARCHGRDLDGWAAPSLVAAVREGSRERFDRMVLDGDIGRGMPGYRSQPAVVDALDAIYAYLAARADGRIGTGAPVPMPARPAEPSRRAP